MTALLLAAAAPATLSDKDTFIYGAVGALVALIVVGILPLAYEIIRGAQPNVTPWTAAAAVVIFLAFMVCGGVAAVIAGDATEARQAIVYGLGWQASIGGAIQGVRAGG